MDKAINDLGSRISKNVHNGLGSLDGLGEMISNSVNEALDLVEKSKNGAVDIAEKIKNEVINATNNKRKKADSNDEEMNMG